MNNNPQSPLTETVRKEITKRMMNGDPDKDIAADYNMSMKCVRSLPLRKWFAILAMEQFQFRRRTNEVDKQTQTNLFDTIADQVRPVKIVEAKNEEQHGLQSN